MITTILTTYRRPQPLKRAIQSVLAQTYPHFQLCIYDNASGDETEMVVKEFNDPRIHYRCHDSNIGMMENYKYAFKQLNSRFFSLLSDDDYLLPNFFELALKGFEQFPDVGFSACGVQVLNQQGQCLHDSLALWNREGYYSALEGVYEMLSSFGKFLYPLGIVFQYPNIAHIADKVLNSYTNALCLRWDSDLLLQIAAHHPIVTNKSSGAVFCDHSCSYSSEFNVKASSSSTAFEDYLKSHHKILTRCIEQTDFPELIKRKMKKLYVANVKREAKVLLANSSFWHKLTCFKLLYKYF